MASYIDMNIKARAKATSDFEKDFFKLASNAVFGKTWKTLGHELGSIRLASRRKTV